MFRNRNMRLRFKPKSGDQIVARAKVSLYEGRGDYQLIVDFVEESGNGALQRAFEELKAKLNSEGLFDEADKQILPDLPLHIGVITSPTGAAVRDIISVLKRRFPATLVSVFPVAVQGNEAPEQIVRAIQLANQNKGANMAALDLLIVGRGGGSQEDLQPFNDERVARAIYASHLPIVSAVGHEIDFTIADFVADLRAPTPSAAAELVSPDQEEWQQWLSGYHSLLNKALHLKLKQSQDSLLSISKRLRHPGNKLREQSQRLDDLETHLCNAMRLHLQGKTHGLKSLGQQLRGLSPAVSINTRALHLENLKHRMQKNIQYTLHDKQQRFQSQVQLLETVSPLATLGRGYAILQKQNGEIIRKTSEVNQGEQIQARLGEGSLLCTVENNNP